MNVTFFGFRRYFLNLRKIIESNIVTGKVTPIVTPEIRVK